MAEVFVDLLAPFSLPRLPTTSVVASAGGMSTWATCSSSPEAP